MDFDRQEKLDKSLPATGEFKRQSERCGQLPASSGVASSLSVAELDNIIPPEIKDDEFYRTILKLSREEDIKTVLEIGSSAGEGSTEAFVSGLRENKNKPTLFCIEVSKPRFSKLQKRYEANSFVKCYHASSIPLNRFLSEDEVVRFYNTTRTMLANYPIDRVLGWLRQDIEYVESSGAPNNGIQIIKTDNGISNFDMVLIDGSAFTGGAELDEVYGAKFILLDDINDIKNCNNYKRLSDDPNYTILTQNWKLRNGYAIFKRNDSAVPIHFFTIVLNGEPFIRYHIEVFKQLPFKWHWHIIEGVADLKHDTAWLLKTGGRISSELHHNGRSNDSTTEYLDELARQYPENVAIYRKSDGVFWDGKLEMVNAPLAEIKQECLLWQVDSDELWTAEQIKTAREMFIAEPDRTAAYYLDHFFVGKDLVTTTIDTYGNNTSYEWLRTWRFKPGYRWTAHEPPRLCMPAGNGKWTDIAAIKPFKYSQTSEKGLVFQHYAYATGKQLGFKEIYYGYKNAIAQWHRLQRQQDFPVFLRDYFAWVKDAAQVNTVKSQHITPIAWTDDNDQWRFGSRHPSLLDCKKALIVRPDAIGDFIVFSNCLSYFRQLHPDARISMLMQDKVAVLAQHCPFIDEVITFQESQVSDGQYRAGLITKLQNKHFDITYYPVYSRSPVGDYITLNSGAARTIAFEGDLSNIDIEQKTQNDALYTELIPSKSGEMLESDRDLEFVKWLVVKAQKSRPTIWISEQEEAFVENLLAEHNVDRFAVIAPFAQAEKREWPLNKWKQVLETFPHETFVIIGGPEKTQKANELMAATSHDKLLNFCGKTSILQSAALIKRSRLFVGSESGPAHMAVAFDIPNVVIIGGGHFGRFMPYSPSTTLVCCPMNCFHCNWRCRYRTKVALCISQISAETVVKAILSATERAVSERKEPLVITETLPYESVQEHERKIVGTDLTDDRCGDGLQPQKGTGLTIATSIAPGQLAKQVNAIKSWIKLGFDVVSINCKEEIETLKGAFPNIRFIQAKRDARNILGRPFIYFDDILEYLMQTDSEICGIINSDVYLAGDENIVSFIRSQAKNSLVYGARTEVDSLENMSGQVYEKGFDFFFFDKSLISHFPKSDFCIGATWWDYWMPLIPILAGCPVKKLVSPFAYHVRHPYKWDEKQWFLMAGKIYGYLREGICEKIASNSLTGHWDLLARMLSTYVHFFIKKAGSIRDKDEYAEILCRSAGYCIPEFLEIESQLIDQAGRQRAKSANADDYADRDITVGISFEDYQKAGELNRHGEDLLNSGDTEGAMNAFTEATRILPNFTAAYNNIGILYLKKAQPVAALKYFTTLLKIDPVYLPGIINAAGVLSRCGKIQVAKNLVISSAQKFIDGGRHSEAAEIYRAYLRENPGDGEIIKALENLGTVELPQAGEESASRCEVGLKATDSTTPSLQPQTSGPESKYLVTAIVSAYNSERFLRGCLEDLENQTIADKLEIIVVNSGSQQNEDTIVNEFQQKFDNIVYIETDQREGIYTAWNRAIKFARGKFITNTNTDDRHRKDALEIMTLTLQANPDVALVYGDQIQTDTPNDTFENHHGSGTAQRPEYSRERLLFGCCVGSQPMWRKLLHDEFGYFDETLTCAGDWDFWLRISQKYKFKHIPEFLGLYYYNPDGIEHGRKIHSLYERYAVGKRYRTSYMSVIPLYEARGNPLVSVVMAAYNAADYITRAIESVLIQNYRNIELIVVDDGSADRTADIVHGFKNEPIKYFFKENGGVASARNFGLKKSSGSFIVILDSDDMMMPDCIARHLQVFEQHPEVDMVYCDDCSIDEEDRPISITNKPEYSDQDALISDLFRCGWALLPFRTCIRKSVFDKIGLYDERLIMSEDYDMVRRFISHGLRMRHLRAALYLRRLTANSLSRSFNAAKAKGHFDVVRKFTETFTADQLFPDVRWDKLPAEQRLLLAKCKTALVYLGIGEQYLGSKAPDFAEAAFEMACSELKDCLKTNPGNHQVQQLLEKSESIRTGYARTVREVVASTA